MHLEAGGGPAHLLEWQSSGWGWTLSRWGRCSGDSRLAGLPATSRGSHVPRLTLPGERDTHGDVWKCRAAWERDPDLVCWIRGASPGDRSEVS